MRETCSISRIVRRYIGDEPCQTHFTERASGAGMNRQAKLFVLRRDVLRSDGVDVPSTTSRYARPYVRGVKVARPRGKLKSGVASDGPEPSPKLKRGRTMEQHSEIFIGLDTSKLKVSVAVANGERNDEVRFYGDIPSGPGSVRSMVDKLATRGARLHFCYEAGPTGYDLHRQIIAMGRLSRCRAVAGTEAPRRSCEDQPRRCS